MSTPTCKNICTYCTANGWKNRAVYCDKTNVLQCARNIIYHTYCISFSISSSIVYVNPASLKISGKPSFDMY